MSTTQFYAIEFCGDEAEGPYDSAEQIMTERELIENDNAWPIAIFKVTLPDGVVAQVDGYMTMRDDVELQPALTPKSTVWATCHIKSITGEILAEAGDMLTVTDKEDDDGRMVVQDKARNTRFIIERGEYTG